MHMNLIFFFKNCRSSGAGKTTLLTEMLINHQHTFAFEPTEVHIYFTESQNAYSKIVQDCNVPVFLHQEMPTLENLPQRNSIIVWDDFQNTKATEVINKFFLKICRHNDITGVFILQNLFDSRDRFIRSINLNSSLLIVFKNVRDNLLISHLSKQAFPGKKNILVKVLDHITKSSPRGYLAIYFSPDLEDKFRIRDSVFVGYRDSAIYILK